MSDTLGSLAYFRSEAGEFNRLLGERSFWETPGRRDAAVKALGHVLLATEEEPDEARRLFEFSIQHCALREEAIIRHQVLAEGGWS